MLIIEWFIGIIRFNTYYNQGSFFWLQSEGRINSGWCISGGNHSHLLLQPEKRTLITMEEWFLLKLKIYILFIHDGILHCELHL
jgi:hypothetical protein